MNNSNNNKKTFSALSHLKQVFSPSLSNSSLYPLSMSITFLEGKKGASEYSHFIINLQ